MVHFASYRQINVLAIIPMQQRLFLLPLLFALLVPLSFATDWATLEQQFVQPPLASKSRPLWFWNRVPNAEETRAQIKALADIGYAGLGILPAFPQNEMKFMSPEFLEQYRIAADAAKEHGLKLCLYDEYWFPSGSAGGLLKEKHPEHLCKRLDMIQATPDTNGKASLTLPEGVLMGCVEMNLKTFARRNITASVKDGVLTWQQPDGDADPYTIMAFVCILDGQRDLVDYLEPESVRVFVELTYAAYQRAMPEHFGTTIDSAFYDEPMLYTPGDGRAWTPRYNEYFEKRFGYDPVPLYPAMFMDIGSDTASARNALFGFRATLLSEGFVKTIADWLEPYGIPLTGHPDQEEIVNPTGIVGDMIKFYEYQDIPGLDQIFQYGRGSSMYKLVSSAAVNYDRHLVMTEVYGAISNMPVANLYKEVMDQAAKGVNVFVPHAVWYDARGPRLMPPELSHRTQPFAAALPKYNEYVGRIHTLLQQPGRTVADVAILYPIESLQATYHFGGPLSAYNGGVSGEADNYMRLGEYLSLVLRRDFFYLHPETLQQRCSVIPSSDNTPALLRLNNENNPVEFQTLILPSMDTISVEILRRVLEFQQAGGNVITVGRLPLQSVEKGKDAEMVALLEAIFGARSVEMDRELYRQLDQCRVEASSEWAAGGYSPQFAFDWDRDTRWNSVDGSENGQWLKFSFPESVKIASIRLHETFDRIAGVQIQTFDTEKNDWTTLPAEERIYTGEEIPYRRNVLKLWHLTFSPIETQEFRILFDHPGQDSISITEVDILNAADRFVFNQGSSMTSFPSPNGGRTGRTTAIHHNPVLPISGIDDYLREALGDGNVLFANERSLPVGTPTGSLMYLHRIIHGRDVYFFSNSTEEPIETTIWLRGEKPRRFEWWNPHDGSREAIEFHGELSNGFEAIPLNLGPVESVFLIGTSDMSSN
ncbi:MAG: discoidin domain-containing protein [Planctomycetaceae bacterium]|nr:discoidin domain-containing protein [Planctomycetaceae bacterium]